MVYLIMPHHFSVLFELPPLSSVTSAGDELKCVSQEIGIIDSDVDSDVDSVQRKIRRRARWQCVQINLIYFSIELIDSASLYN